MEQESLRLATTCSMIVKRDTNIADAKKNIIMIIIVIMPKLLTPVVCAIHPFTVYNLTVSSIHLVTAVQAQKIYFRKLVFHQNISRELNGR